MINYKRIIYFFVPALITFFSCSKTDYETSKRPYNNIVKFSVAGYGGLDSVDAVIRGDEILIYWNSDSPLPTLMKPTILVSAGAKIHPASGSEIAFTDTTVYKVTAEDGTIRTYTVKPIVRQPKPILLSPSTQELRWGASPNFNLLGEYFLSTSLDQIKVYGQRISDGYEFDLAFDSTTATSTSLAVKLPDFTAEQDTGWHKIWLKVGNLESESVDVYIQQPPIEYAGMKMSVVGEGKPIKLGQQLIVNYSFDGPAARYYNKNVISASLNIQGIPNPNGPVLGTGNIVLTDMIVTDNQMSFTIPVTTATNRTIGGYVLHLAILARSPLSNRPTYGRTYYYEFPNKLTFVTAPN